MEGQSVEPCEIRPRWDNPAQSMHSSFAEAAFGKSTALWKSYSMRVSGFIDIDMETITHDAGIGQRRCGRAIALPQEAGFMRVKQPRRQNEEDAYFGCRAIRSPSRHGFRLPFTRTDEGRERPGNSRPPFCHSAATIR